jgi:hypothetical protein
MAARDAFFKALWFFGYGINEIEITKLPWQFFHPGSNLGYTLFFYSTSCLKRLVIALYNSSVRVSQYMNLCTRMRSGQLRNFLGSLSNLVDLSLSIPISRDANGRYDESVDLSQVLPPDISKLKKLRLEYFETSESFFTQTLLNNAPSLQRLVLGDMYLNPYGSWAHIFTTFQHHQQKLQSARLSGEFCDSVNLNLYLLPRGTPVIGTEDGWDFNQATTIARALEKYLVSGGACPLRDEDKRGVRLQLPVIYLGPP